MNAFANGYSYRRKLTVDNTKVSGSSNLTDFPMLISGTYAYLKVVSSGGKVTNSSGFDIIFTSDAGGATKLDHEIEKYVSTTGQIVMWIRISSLTFATGNVIYMFYGKSSVSTTQENVNGTWNSSYKLVSHLPDGTTLTAQDSTSNANHGTLGNTPTAVSGEIGGGASFAAASSQYIAKTSAANLPNIEGPLTMSLWMKFASTASRRIAFSLPKDDSSGANNSNDIELSGSDLRVGKWGGTAIVSTTSPSINTWHLVHYTIDGLGNAKLYVDAGTPATGGSPNSGAATMYRIGSFNTAFPSPYWNDQLDEARILNTVLTPDWITTEYNNQNAPSTFYTVDNEASNSGLALGFSF